MIYAVLRMNEATLILSLINAVACCASAAYLFSAMKATHRKNNVNFFIVKTEWVLLSVLIMLTLDQSRDIVNGLYGLYYSAEVWPSVVWVFSVWFSNYLKLEYV